MGKLIYSLITSLDGYVADAAEASTGASRTSRFTPSSTTSRDQSAPTSTGVACMR